MSPVRCRDCEREMSQPEWDRVAGFYDGLVLDEGLEKELYKVRRWPDGINDGWFDDNLWTECAKEARLKIMGEGK